MYLYQPCLLTLSLYAWAFDEQTGWRRWLSILFPLIILLLSEWELAYATITIYPAALLLPIVFVIRKAQRAALAETLCACILGGLVSWMSADAWPLLPGLTILCAALLLSPVLLLCRNREDRRLACAFGGLVFELFFCLKEYLLFSYAVVRLGSREGLSVTAAGLCFLCLLERVQQMATSLKKRRLSTRI